MTPNVTVKPVADQPALLLERNGERALVVADLHLGWEVTLARQGIHVPSQVPRLLDRLKKIIQDTKSQQVVLLGDVKHAVAKVELEEWKYVPEFFEGLAEIIPTIHVVPGNHDGNLEPLTPPSVKIHQAPGLVLWSVGLFHGHAWPSPALLSCNHLVMGHLHPVVVFKDPLGFRITKQVWVRAKASGEKLAEGLLKYQGVKYEGDPAEKAEQEFGVDVVLDSDCTIMPSFNDYLGGQPINRNFSEGWSELYRAYMGPVLRSGAIDFEEGEAYLFDGTFLGIVRDLRQLNQ